MYFTSSIMYGFYTYYYYVESYEYYKQGLLEDKPKIKKVFEEIVNNKEIKKFNDKEIEDGVMFICKLIGITNCIVGIPVLIVTKIIEFFKFIINILFRKGN